MVYGRNFFTRYDYENCQGEPCNAMMAELQASLNVKFVEPYITCRNMFIHINGQQFA